MSVLEMQPAVPIAARLDRQVRYMKLRLAEHEERTRAVFALEEALRLAELPGENEGRVYFFRKVELLSMPVRASRSQWMSSVQATLLRCATEAVHGRTQSAARSDAVYFPSADDSLQEVLRLALYPASDLPWFAGSVLGIEHGVLTATTCVARIMERLRAMPFAAAAQIILSALQARSPALLLDKLPEPLLREWLRALEASAGSAPAKALEIALPPAEEHLVLQAAGLYGWRQPQTVWMAALVLARLSPRTGGVVRRAQMALRQLETSTTRTNRRSAAGDCAPSADSDDSLAHGQLIADAHGTDAEGRVDGSTAAAQWRAAAKTAQPQDSNDDLSTVETAITTEVLGEPTAFAGLYFALHILRHLGIASALRSCPDLEANDLVGHILRRLAADARAPMSDAILAPLGCIDAAFQLAPEVLLALPNEAFPSTYAGPAKPWTDADRLPRLWTVAVRQWCRQHAGISMREMICRPGLVWMSRTDVDVTLPFSAVDVRLRRAGLDLDPLWVPWLGEFGRVVRFHYREQLTIGGHDARDSTTTQRSL